MNRDLVLKDERHPRAPGVVDRGDTEQRIEQG